MVSEAFVRFFVEIVGHYSLFLTAGEREERTLQLQREAFRKAVSSKSLRRFLEVFMETQTFRGFIQERELRRQDAKGRGPCRLLGCCFPSAPHAQNPASSSRASSPLSLSPLSLTRLSGTPFPPLCGVSPPFPQASSCPFCPPGPQGWAEEERLARTLRSTCCHQRPAGWGGRGEGGQQRAPLPGLGS